MFGIDTKNTGSGIIEGERITLADSSSTESARWMGKSMFTFSDFEASGDIGGIETVTVVSCWTTMSSESWVVCWGSSVSSTAAVRTLASFWAMSSAAWSAKT
jgi:hypothetical protein